MGPLVVTEINSFIPNTSSFRLLFSMTGTGCQSIDITLMTRMCLQ
ncbi:hypothetical protein HanIR_Chr10g0470241 [Helianthus annuus]|nr:hypothetical protein HanIR_Chr10g0470241 [Helianthus annuus]